MTVIKQNIAVNNKFLVPELVKASSGIGLRAPHHDVIIEKNPPVGWLEIHGENYFCSGGAQLDYLEKVRELYPISIHCVGLSLGSSDGINKNHLQKLKELTERFTPCLISDHLSWSGLHNRFVPDLLPLPMTDEALHTISNHIDEAQEYLQRPILIENPSAYLSFIEQDMSETQFLTEITKRTGCGLLLDINNIHVSAHNISAFKMDNYLSEIPIDAVGEIHLAGYQINNVEGHEILIDAHNNPVYTPVWDAYKLALKRFGNVPTMIEWDNDLPPLETLVNEAQKADEIRKEILSLELKNVRTA